MVNIYNKRGKYFAIKKPGISAEISPALIDRGIKNHVDFIDLLAIGIIRNDDFSPEKAQVYWPVFEEDCVRWKYEIIKNDSLIPVNLDEALRIAGDPEYLNKDDKYFLRKSGCRYFFTGGWDINQAVMMSIGYQMPQSPIFWKILVERPQSKYCNWPIMDTAGKWGWHSGPISDGNAANYGKDSSECILKISHEQAKRLMEDLRKQLISYYKFREYAWKALDYSIR